jgi:hypothetical protein
MLSMVTKAHPSILQVSQVVSTVVQPIYHVRVCAHLAQVYLYMIIGFELFAIIQSNPDRLLTSKELQNIDVGLILLCLYVRLID